MFNHWLVASNIKPLICTFVALVAPIRKRGFRWSKHFGTYIPVAAVGKWEILWRQAFLYIFRQVIPHSNIFKRVGTSHPLGIFRIQDGGRVPLEENIFHNFSSFYLYMCNMIIFLNELLDGNSYFNGKL